MDGIFDLFHRGHLEAIKKCSQYGDEILIGIISDKDAISYKRKPIIKEEDRIEIIKNIKMVSEVICPCPLIMTEDFMNDNSIDLVIHGFNGEDDYNKQKSFFEIPIKLNKFRRIDYYKETSTTEIIQNIKNTN